MLILKSPISRRNFIAGSAAALAAGAVAPQRAFAANDKIMLGAIGTGGRCQALIRDFLKRGDCEVSWVCDADLNRLNPFAKEVADIQGKAPRTTQEMHELLAAKDVDAVVIGTPDHWHALATIWACQAGKDVYVEKPPTHNVWEGRRMIEAARKYDRVVQIGTQNRSAPYNMKAIEYIKSGGIGDIHLVRVHNLKSGAPQFNVPDSPEPDGVAYDKWLGPAPTRAFNKNHFHGGWHGYWAYSNGEMADDGIHQIDLARWVIGKSAPKSVVSQGGNMGLKDDRETPDTIISTLDFDDLVMTIEVTLWPPYMTKTTFEERDGDTFPHWPMNATRIELYGTKQLMVLGRHGDGWQAMTANGHLEKQEQGPFPDPEHKEDFFRAVRERKRPSADVEDGHLSMNLVHLANIAYRTGAKLDWDAANERVTNNEAANAMLKREYRSAYEVPAKV